MLHAFLLSGSWGGGWSAEPAVVVDCGRGGLCVFLAYLCPIMIGKESGSLLSVWTAKIWGAVAGEAKGTTAFIV